MSLREDNVQSSPSLVCTVATTVASSAGDVRDPSNVFNRPRCKRGTVVASPGQVTFVDALQSSKAVTRTQSIDTFFAIHEAYN